MIVSRVAVNGAANWRHLLSAQRLMAQQAEDRGGVHHTEELAARIGPQVFRSAPHGDCTGGDQSDQLVLIDGQFILVIGILRKIRTKPVWEGSHNAGHLLAAGKSPPAYGSASATRIVRDGH